MPPSVIRIVMLRVLIGRQMKLTRTVLEIKARDVMIRMRASPPLLKPFALDQPTRLDGVSR